MSYPGACITAHPINGIDDLIVQLLQWSMKDWFMMHHSISESSDRVETPVSIASFLSAPSPKCSIQALPPKSSVVVSSEETDPECEFKFSDNIVWIVWLGELTL